MKNILILAAMVLFAMSVNAQTVYTVKSSKMTIAGTSSMHDWESTVGKTTITGLLNLDNGIVAKSGDFEVKIAVKSIKSPKGKIMDNKTYDALKAEEHPNIRFALGNLTYKSTNDKSGQITATGSLTIAGVTRNETLTMTATQAGNELTIKGSKKLKMTDFKISPPTALLGAMKTGDEVTIHFEVVMNRQADAAIGTN